MLEFVKSVNGWMWGYVLLMVNVGLEEIVLQDHI